MQRRRVLFEESAGFSSVTQGPSLPIRRTLNFMTMFIKA
jgi:hypothetical protein